jgi:hypothetical protein
VILKGGEAGVMRPDQQTTINGGFVVRVSDGKTQEHFVLMQLQKINK